MGRCRTSDGCSTQQGGCACGGGGCSSCGGGDRGMRRNGGNGCQCGGGGCASCCGGGDRNSSRRDSGCRCGGGGCSSCCGGGGLDSYRNATRNQGPKLDGVVMNDCDRQIEAMLNPKNLAGGHIQKSPEGSTMVRDNFNTIRAIVYPPGTAGDVRYRAFQYEKNEKGELVLDNGHPQIKRMIVQSDTQGVSVWDKDPKSGRLVETKPYRDQSGTHDKRTGREIAAALNQESGVYGYNALSGFQQHEQGKLYTQGLSGKRNLDQDKAAYSADESKTVGNGTHAGDANYAGIQLGRADATVQRTGNDRQPQYNDNRAGDTPRRQVAFDQARFASNQDVLKEQFPFNRVVDNTTSYAKTLWHAGNEGKPVVMTFVRSGEQSPEQLKQYIEQINQQNIKPEAERKNANDTTYAEHIIVDLDNPGFNPLAQESQDPKTKIYGYGVNEIERRYPTPTTIVFTQHQNDNAGTKDRSPTIPDKPTYPPGKQVAQQRRSNDPDGLDDTTDPQITNDMDGLRVALSQAAQSQKVLNAQEQYKRLFQPKPGETPNPTDTTKPGDKPVPPTDQTTARPEQLLNARREEAINEIRKFAAGSEGAPGPDGRLQHGIAGFNAAEAEAYLDRMPGMDKLSLEDSMRYRTGLYQEWIRRADESGSAEEMGRSRAMLGLASVKWAQDYADRNNPAAASAMYDSGVQWLLQGGSRLPAMYGYGDYQDAVRNTGVQELNTMLSEGKTNGDWYKVNTPEMQAYEQARQQWLSDPRRQQYEAARYEAIHLEPQKIEENYNAWRTLNAGNEAIRDKALNDAGGKLEAQREANQETVMNRLRPQGGLARRRKAA